MSGANVNWREGNRSEYLAQFAFSTIGFTVPVPRQEDYTLVDLFVHLNSESGVGGQRTVHPTGLAIAVQIKSNTDPINLSAKQLQLISEMQLPWFVAIVDRTTSQLRVYATIDRHFFRGFDRSTTLKFTDRPRGSEDLHAGDGLAVGPPVLVMNLSDLDGGKVIERAAARDRFRAVVASWAIADAINISALRESAGYVLRPRDVPIGEAFGVSQTEPITVPGLVNRGDLARTIILRLEVLSVATDKGQGGELEPRLRDRLILQWNKLASMLDHRDVGSDSDH